MLGILVPAAGLLLSGLAAALMLRPRHDKHRIEIAKGVHMPLVLNGITDDHGVWLALGGRGIDSGFLYGDEQQRQVGDAIRDSGVAREDIFLVTKVNCCPTARCSRFCARPPFPNAAPPMAVHNATEMLEHSLKVLGQPYADLVLMHFPCTDFHDTAATWAALEAAHARGWARAIGLSNVNASLLRRLLRVAKVKPAVVQNAFSIAGHPPAHRGAAGPCQEGDPLYGSDDETLSFCRRRGITFSAYSPLGSISKVNVLEQPAVRAAAAAHSKSTAQVALKWLVQQRVAAVTSTSRPKHILEALDLSSFTLTRAEMRALWAAR